MSELPKGFYTDAEGNQRFWDGENWFDAAPGSAPKKSGPNLIERLKALLSKFKDLDKKKKIIFAGSFALVVLLIGGGIGYANYAESERVRLVQVAEEEAAAAAAAAEAQAAADAAAAVESAVAARRETVTEVEASVKKMAKKHVRQGMINGPIKSVSCVPSDGSAIDDLTVNVTKFECFAVNKVNSDGTSNGYYYNATLDWNAGSWTYGYGRG